MYQKEDLVMACNLTKDLSCGWTITYPLPSSSAKWLRAPMRDGCASCASSVSGTVAEETPMNWPSDSTTGKDTDTTNSSLLGGEIDLWSLIALFTCVFYPDLCLPCVPGWCRSTPECFP